jgi:hypothetical protein
MRRFKQIGLLWCGFAVAVITRGAAEEPAAKAVPEKVVQSVSNLRQLSLALFAFDAEYGEFPSKETGEDVKEATGTSLEFGTATSNEYFRQLIASVVGSERIFQLGATAKLADDRIKAGEALVKGECDFAYVTGSTTANDPATPLVLGPLVPGKLKFDPVPLAGKAVVLTVDGAVRTFPITADGDVILDDKSLFDPAQPYWKDRKPVVAWPE